MDSSNTSKKRKLFLNKENNVDDWKTYSDEMELKNATLIRFPVFYAIDPMDYYEYNDHLIDFSTFNDQEFEALKQQSIINIKKVKEKIKQEVIEKNQLPNYLETKSKYTVGVGIEMFPRICFIKGSVDTVCIRFKIESGIFKIEKDLKFLIAVWKKIEIVLPVNQPFSTKIPDKLLNFLEEYLCIETMSPITYLRTLKKIEVIHTPHLKLTPNPYPQLTKKDEKIVLKNLTRGTIDNLGLEKGITVNLESSNNQNSMKYIEPKLDMFLPTVLINLISCFV